MTEARGQDLPHGLRLLIEAAGEEAALKIALERGGSRLQVPKRAEGTVLEELVGIDAARAIVDSLAGETIEVPLANRALNDALRAEGWSQQRRASSLRVALRTIKNWDSGATPRHPASLQGDLFRTG